MRLSRLFGGTSKTEGVDYKISSHRLLTQAGFIRESAAGRYYLLPLGLKVHDKIIQIVRKHMDNSGAQEILMPVLHPLELWRETNRISTTGFELITVKDRRDAEFALGGTAEEMAVDLIRKFNLSYKDLPFNIYQFSMKFRDEIRARGGLLRVREFVMKDAYSFSTEEQFKEFYQLMWDTYGAIFDELGLEYDVVQADNGYIGGEYCHEFVIPSEAGESRYFVTKDGSYAAHEDVAIFKKYDVYGQEELKPRHDIKGKGIIGVEALAKHLDISVEKTTKTILFEDTEGRVVAAAVNGLYDINETKLQHIIGGAPLQLASAETVKKVTGAEVGYAGFLNLPKNVVVVLDDSLKGRKNFEVGANQTDYHSINVNFGRDFPEPKHFYDIAMAKEGYEALNSQKLIEKRGIEVGNIFQLGYHYSKLMKGAEYTDKQGERQPYYMGCYGFGIGRALAAIVEVNHDSKGIVWPIAIAPALIFIARLGDSKETIKTADDLYQKLQDEGVEVLYDDRDVRPGEKFADAELMGMPYRVVVSDKTVKNKQFELKKRSETDIRMVSLEELLKIIASKK
ncbi:MAG TPA: proline--tRNA ligase [Candidatus Saccharimonadales bacterium]|nr:proline--tRNA ligase [Candidatus Saccharimonadales bacterium]